MLGAQAEIEQIAQQVKVPDLTNTPFQRLNELSRSFQLFWTKMLIGYETDFDSRHAGIVLSPFRSAAFSVEEPLRQLILIGN
jgi:hypothetical protein